MADGSNYLENSHIEEEITIEKPNILSEELIRCLIGIYIKINHNLLGSKGSAMVPKHYFSCSMNPKDYISIISFSRTVPTFRFDDDTVNIAPYGTLIGLTTI